MKQRTWLPGCLAAALAVMLTGAALHWGYRFYHGEVPLSSLPVQVTEERWARRGVPTDIPILWPSSSRQRFPPLSDSRPVSSPDGQFYIQLSEVGLCLFESVTHRTLGCYSFRELIIYRWAEDSSGVYLSDYIPGRGALFIIEPSIKPYVGSVKKVLVPCRGSLEGVSILPRLYWEMRCAFSEPYSWVAVWLPLVVLLIGLAVVVGISIWMMLWLWRHWVRPWWYGE